MKDDHPGIGAAPRRKEDARLMTGGGRFLADIAPKGMAHAVFLRSPVAHATFVLENLDQARRMPGVLAVLSAEDVAELGPLPWTATIENADGSTPPVPEFPALARDTVRFVGDAVAMIVAETDAAARDAAEAINLSFNDRPVAVDMKDALAESAPVIWPEIGTNVAFDTEIGDRDATAAAFAAADRVIGIEVVNNRLVTNYMETRGSIGEYDARSGRYTLTVSSQGVHLIRPVVAGRILKVAPDRLRVITPDVGGGFGTKYFTYREYGLVLFAARKLGRPVRWIADRTDHFLADYHGRDNITSAEMAIDGKGRFLALRVDTLANMGACLSQLGPFIPWVGAPMLTGCYRIPAAHIRLRGVYTNTVPVDAYRGAGRPEAAYVIERLVDAVARETGIRPETVRARNFVTRSMMPFTTATGRVYDSGDFKGVMDAALQRADARGFSKRARAAARRGKIAGFGFAVYIEACAGGNPEHARVVLDEKGGATIHIGTQSQGQGHDTAYSQLLGAALGIPMESVTLVQGDSDRIARGYGTGGSRSIPVGGSSVARAGEVLAERIRDAAADRLEAAPADIELAGGAARVAGTDRSVPLGDLVAGLGKDDREASEDWQPPAPTYPNGCHAVEVEIDRETGIVDIVDYVIVDDFGVALNPMMLEGQIHGGVMQGLGQALMERTVHDETGQLLTASFMDYCLPRADSAPEPRFEMRNIPCRTNALGMKGAGEAGSIGACPAVVNAVVDALWREFGSAAIDMPMTPERVWRAVRDGEAAIAEAG